MAAWSSTISVSAGHSIGDAQGCYLCDKGVQRLDARRAEVRETEVSVDGVLDSHRSSQHSGKPSQLHLVQLDSDGVQSNKRVRAYEFCHAWDHHAAMSVPAQSGDGCTLHIIQRELPAHPSPQHCQR
eukprot:1238139-Rhodomonas_salina.2